MRSTLAALMLAASLGAQANATNLPPMNPWLADSTWPRIHGGSDSCKISRHPGPTVASHALRADELRWRPVGPFEMVTAALSSPYPDGRRTLLLGLQQALVKLDADTLETLATYSLREGPQLSPVEVDQFIRDHDRLVASGTRQQIYDHAARFIAPALQGEAMGNVYTFVNRDNERLVFWRDPSSGHHWLRFFGDAVQGDASSAIVLRRQWELPAVGGRPFIPFAAEMTRDGRIVVVSNAGAVIAVKNDFSAFRTLDLAGTRATLRDSMQGYVRNGISVDDRNGIYIVTHDELARVQWTGDRLSTDAADGAWRVTYPSGARGSGVTPALMGWGEGEDHLVAIADGTDEDPHLMLFWRDAIPADWQGIPGQDRRVAAVVPVMFEPGKKAPARIENSPPVMGYGIFAAAESPTQPVPPQGSVIKQYIAESMAGALTGSEATGGTRWEWNPRTRELRQVWMTPLKLAQSICTPSVNGLLYCIGRRDGAYTLEGIDWATGASVVHYRLGQSFRFFSYNNLVVMPNGAVDLFNWMGLTRMQPRAPAHDTNGE